MAAHEPYAGIIKWSLARFAEGDDLGTIIRDACREAYRMGAESRVPFADEVTPRVDLWPEDRPSDRPTVPAPMPKGVKR